MSALKQTNDDYIVSYLLLRQLIGILGLVLPFALIFGNHWLGNESWLQPSISHYFYSFMHFSFVGVLFILGAILISYREKENRLANRVSTFAGAFAFGVGIFPTEFKGFNDNAYIVTSNWESWFKWIHFGSAFFLFTCFAIFCFVIFQKSDKDISPSHFDKKKKLRNRIYKICGWGIVVSIVMIAACTLYEKYVGVTLFTKYSTFIFETTALLFFGNSWLLKGSVKWKTDDNKLLRTVVAPVR
jgi:heme A synthase